MAKDIRIAFRADETTKQRLVAASEKVGLNESSLASACVDALINYIEEHGEITLPLVLIPKKEFEGLKKKPLELPRSETAKDRAVRRRTA